MGGSGLGDLVVGPVGRGHVVKENIARGLVRAAAEDGVDDLHGFGAGDGPLGAEAAALLFAAFDLCR